MARTSRMWNLPLLASNRLTRRRFLRGAMSVGSAIATDAVIVSHSVAAPMRSRNASDTLAESDAKTLVVLDNMPAQNWVLTDPADNYNINPTAAVNLLYESLYYMPDAGNLTDIRPLLAASMPEISQDGLTATIKLRQGIKFASSGNPMTANDWAFSLTRLGNLKRNSAFLFSDYFAKAEAIDPGTLRLTLKKPNAALIAILASLPLAVIDSATAKSHGGTDAPDADRKDKLSDWINTGHSIGTGPMIMTAWDPTSEVVLERNPAYWGNPMKVDRVIFRNVADPNTQLQTIETGDADIAFAIDPDAVASVKSNPAMRIFEGASLAFEYLAMNTIPDVGGPLAKQAVRQAIAYTIDYDGIISDLLAGGAVRPATVVPLGLLGAQEVESLAYKTNLARAQQLFDSTALGKVEITLSYGASEATPAGLSRETLATKLKSDIERIKGITLKLHPMDSAARLAQFRAGKLQFVMSDWSADYPDVNSFAEPFGRGGTGAAMRVGYNDPGVAKLLDQGITELDPGKRKQIYVDIQKMFIEEAAFLAEFQPKYRSPASSRITGAQPHGVYILNLRDAAKST